MKVLITGSTGFVGRHLVPMLESAGYEIFHLVRNKKGFEHEFVWDFKGPLPDGIPKCDVIIHLAAYVDFSLNLNVAQYNVNTVSTIKLSSYAKDHNAYFIFASMAGIHGTKYPQISKDTPIAPENHYAVSKYLAEEVVKTYINNYSILRICGIYGIDGPSHLGLNKAISDAVYQMKTPVLRGKGNAKKNYICVLDVALWILSLIERYKASNKNIKEILYLASEEIMSIEEYLQSIADVVLKDVELIRTEGNEAKDWIVTPSEPPFNLRRFREYLNSLIHS